MSEIRDKVIGDNHQTRAAAIRLPQPKVLSPRVDFERTKVWDVEHVTWVPRRGDEDEMRSQATLHAQRLVEHAANSDEIMNEARTSAEQVIEAAYRMVDWQVTVQWESATPPSEPGRSEK